MKWNDRNGRDGHLAATGQGVRIPANRFVAANIHVSEPGKKFQCSGFSHLIKLASPITNHMSSRPWMIISTSVKLSDERLESGTCEKRRQDRTLKVNRSGREQRGVKSTWLCWWCAGCCSRQPSAGHLRHRVIVLPGFTSKINLSATSKIRKSLFSDARKSISVMLKIAYIYWDLGPIREITQI